MLYSESVDLERFEMTELTITRSPWCHC